MIPYLMLTVTSVRVGLAAVLLAWPGGRFSMRAFLAGVLANVLALGAIFFWEKRRRL